MTDEGTSGRKKKPPTRLATVIRSLREQRRMTSENVAELSGLSHQWVRNYEAGFIQSITADKIRALERAFDLRTGELYAVALGVSYDQLVRDITADHEGRNVPWEQLLESQQEVASALAALVERISPSVAPSTETDEAAALAADRLKKAAQRAGGRADRRSDGDEA